MPEFDIYQTMKLQGADALAAYSAAKVAGLDQITSIRMLRTVYSLSLEEAKKISFLGDTGKKLEESNDENAGDYTKIIDDILGTDH